MKVWRTRRSPGLCSACGIGGSVGVRLGRREGDFSQCNPFLAHRGVSGFNTGYSPLRERRGWDSGAHFVLYFSKGEIRLVEIESTNSLLEGSGPLLLGGDGATLCTCSGDPSIMISQLWVRSAWIAGLIRRSQLAFVGKNWAELG